MDNLLVSADSYNFIWAYYGFCDFPIWEDFTIYVKRGGKYSKLTRLCICSKIYHRESLEELKDMPSEKDYVFKIEQFLQSKEINYYYFYDALDDDEIYEVCFDAPLSHEGLKPRSIELWSPYERVDLNSVVESVTDFYKKHFGERECTVKLKINECRHKAYKEYCQYVNDFSQGVDVVFSNELVEKMKLAMNKSEEEIVRLLEVSLK